MIFDQIIEWILLIVITFLLGLQILLENLKGRIFEYGTICKLKTIIKTSLLVIFTVMSFLFGLFGLHLLEMIFFSFGINVSLLIYFFYDLLYVQPRTKEYIYYLQKLSSKECDYRELLRCETTTDKYSYDESLDNKSYFIITVKNKKCIYLPGSEEGLLLYPRKKKTTQKELEHICEQLNLDRERVTVFKNDNIYQFEDLYVENYGNKIYFFIKNIMMNKTKKISAIIILMLIAIFYCLFILMYFCFGWSFLNWTVKE